MSNHDLHNFCVYYFQNIMDCTDVWRDEYIVRFWQLRERVGLAHELRDRFNLKYSTKTIWNTISSHYIKNFDYILFYAIP